METDLVPPSPPSLPPPVSPPVALPEEIPSESPTALWRWNDRLAIVAGGLALLLVGVFAGKQFFKSGAPLGGPQDTQLSSSTADFQIDAAPEEVNPPELLVTTPASVPEPSEASTPKAEATAPAEIPIAAEALPANVAAAAPPAAQAPVLAEDRITIEAGKPLEETEPVFAQSDVPTIRVARLAVVCAAEKKFKDHKLNTAITWAQSGNDAAQQAEEEKKLVFLIHVSGNFEMPGFT